MVEVPVPARVATLITAEDADVSVHVELEQLGQPCRGCVHTIKIERDVSGFPTYSGLGVACCGACRTHILGVVSNGRNRS